MPKQTNPSTNPLSGMPPEIAQALQQRGELAPAAVNAIAPAKTLTDAEAKLSAMTAELAAMTGHKVAQHSEAQAVVSDLIAPAASAVQPASIEPPALKASVDRVIRTRQPQNPNSRYIDLPPDIDAFIKSQTQTIDHGCATAFQNAAGYYSAFHELTSKVQSLPVTMPAPNGWVAEFIGKGSHIDPADLLSQQPAQRHAEMLHDLIRWACTVQRAQEADNVRSALEQLQQRGKRSDARLQAGAGAAMLNKFNTLVALMQTKAFGGKPDLLVQCLVEDWRWMESGVAYRTPLAELAGYPALFDSARMLPGAFIQAGSLSNFMLQHREHLIDEYSESTALRDSQYGSVSIAALQKHSWIKAERIRATADSPVIVQLGYQEQLGGGSSIDRDGTAEGWRDSTALTLTMDGDTLDIKPGSIPHDSAVHVPVLDAVKAIQLLNDAAK